MVTTQIKTLLSPTNTNSWAATTLPLVTIPTGMLSRVIAVSLQELGSRQEREF